LAGLDAGRFPPKRFHSSSGSIAEWTDEQKRDAAFFLDTIWSDALDLFQERDDASFLILCLSNIERIVNLLCKLHDRLPLHSKHY
jgi:hypothetical protein